MDPITLVVTGIFAALAIVIVLLYKTIKDMADFFRTFDVGKLITSYEMDREKRDREAQTEAKKLSDMPMETWAEASGEPTLKQQVKWYEIRVADLEKQLAMLGRENQRLRMAQENRQVETEVVEVEAS